VRLREISTDARFFCGKLKIFVNAGGYGGNGGEINPIAKREMRNWRSAVWMKR